MSILGAAIGGGASIIGSVLGANAQADANAQNMAIARMNLNFQRRSRRDAYQTAVHNMVRAGLNPMLAYSQGPAPVTQGSSAVMQPTIKGNPGAEAASAAMAAMKQSAEVEVLNTQAAKNEADTTLSSAQAAKTVEETRKTGFDISKVIADENLSRASARQIESNIHLQDWQKTKISSEIQHLQNSIGMQASEARSAAAIARVDEARAALADIMNRINSSNFGEIMTYVDRVTQSLGLARRATDR